MHSCKFISPCMLSTSGRRFPVVTRSFQRLMFVNSANNQARLFSTTGHKRTTPTDQKTSTTGSDRSQSKKWTILLGVGVVGVGAALYAKFQTAPPDDGKTKTTGIFGSRKPVVELPSHTPYLIIGAGTAAYAAYRAIRASDATAKVLLLGDEDRFPYMRPPLSKELWYSDDRELVKQLKFTQWNGKERSIFYEKDGFYCEPKELPNQEFGGVAVALGQKVVRLDVKERVAHLDNGKSVTFDKCLIATGGKPKNLPVFANAGVDVMSRCSLFRNVEDYWKLDKALQSSKSVAVVGGGFLGSELACALGKRGKDKNVTIYQMFPEKGNMGQVLPEYLSKWTTNKVRKEGVDVRPEVTVTSCSFSRSSRQIILGLSDGTSLSVDHVVVAVGLAPNTELADTAGLELDEKRGGFLVNAELEARSNVWVAGDAACFYDTKLGRRRVEHHDHAVVSGRLAGENMTGAGKPYWHQSMFWSDLGPDVGYEAIGLVDSTLPTVGVFARGSEADTPRAVVQQTGENIRSETEQQPAATSLQQQPSVPVESPDDYGKGVIFYLRDKVVVGVIMWNVFNKMAVARQLIKEGKQHDDLAEVSKLFNLYGDKMDSAAEENAS